MRKIIILGFAVVLSFAANAQTTLSGKITDKYRRSPYWSNYYLWKRKRNCN